MSARPRPQPISRTPEPAAPDVLVRARGGDRDAFERLAVEAMPMLLGTARRLGGDGFAAEEIVAEALFRAWRHIGRFRGDAAFSTWLHRIVCRVAADRVRRVQRDRAHREVLVRRAEGAGRARGADPVARREARLRLRAAIDLLPERQRLVLVLHAWEGLDLRETARVLGIRYATAKSNLCHARKALRRLLDEEDA